MNKLCKELPGILAWAVQGCLDWQKEGLGHPDEVESATAEYRQNMDMTGDFLNERCVIEPENHRINVQIKELYDDYLTWCRSNSEDPITKT